MTGSLQKKGSLYYVVYRDSSGKQKWVSTKLRDKNKAKSKMREILYEIEHGTYIEPRKEVFIDFLLEYFNNSVIRDVKETTFDGYMGIIDNHIAPYFKIRGYKLQDIKTIDIQEYFNEKYKQGFKTSTLNRHLSIFKRVFSYVEDMELIHKNPTAKVRLSKVDDKTEQNCYSIEELNQLLEAVSDDVIAVAVVLAAIYGLRRGELLGLRWRDVDFENRIIRIVNTRTKVYRSIEKGPKTKTSIKEFYMFENVAEYLMLLMKKQKEDADIFGNCYNNNDYVVRYSDGRPISIATIDYRFNRILEKNGLRHIRLHDLRHTVATLMLEGGFSIKIVQSWMRHANPNTLMKVYAHISPSAKSEMDTKIENFFTSNIKLSC
ncbi:MAG TPA: site-specific integrase [Bacillota bacterium]|nr:site-specific integrase [Bacillota bacterium]